jgi:hypothetical protein
MDFIMDLPTSIKHEDLNSSREAYNTILVVMDYISKIAYLILIRKLLKGEELAYLLVYKVFRLHGVPVNIVTN